MPKDESDVHDGPKTTRRAVLKGLLVGLGASVLVQSAGGVVGFGEQEKGTDQKIEHKAEHKNEIKSEKIKIDKTKMEKTNKKDSKSKNEKKKAEEPKNQRTK